MMMRMGLRRGRYLWGGGVLGVVRVFAALGVVSQRIGRQCVLVWWCPWEGVPLSCFPSAVLRGGTFFAGRRLRWGSEGREFKTR